MISIQSYMADAKKHKNDAGIIVIGNEAADLDSMASSLAYAFLLSLQDPRVTVLPVMPIPRADFSLRSEVVYVFKEAHINLHDVVFFDEVEFDSLMAKAKLVLVDHNKLTASLEKYNAQVIAVLDHHKDEGLYDTANPRIIETIGSTTSLVAREFNRAYDEISFDIAALIGGTILLDTVNLDDQAGRVTDTDKEIADQVLPLCPLLPQEFFENIQKEKFNVAGLSTNDLLRKDYKEWQFATMKCGIASALLSVTDWSEMDNDLATGFAAFSRQHNLDVLLSMNASIHPDFNRGLILFCKSKDAQDALFSYLQENGLGLTVLDCPVQKQADSGCIRFYIQGNLDISRKKLQPLLANFCQKK